MKSLGMALFGAILACTGTAAQATVFDFGVVYWEEGDTPPANPDASQTAHFQLDDTSGTRTPPESHYQSIRFFTPGQFFGFDGVGMIDLYPESSFGGLDMTPWSDDEGPDWANGRSLWGDAIVGEDLDFPHISTGVFYMGDYGERTGTYRVTITEAAVAAAVPEPASWAMMLGGFGAIGGAMRSRRKATVRFA